MKTASKAKTAPVATVVEAPAVTSTNAAYQLAGKAASDRATLQAGAKTGLGKGWRAAATAKPNSRLTALATLQALGDTFTEAEAMAALATVKADLGSGTPRSYYKAFLACGYITEAI